MANILQVVDNSSRTTLLKNVYHVYYVDPPRCNIGRPSKNQGALFFKYKKQQKGLKITNMLFNLFVLIIVLCTTGYYASVLLEFIFIWVKPQMGLNVRYLSIFMVTLIYFVILGPLFYHQVNIPFLSLGEVECEGSLPGDGTDSADQARTVNTTGTFLQDSARAMMSVLKDNYVAPVTAFTVAAAATKVLNTVPSGSRAKLVIATISTLGGISVASQGIATLRAEREANQPRGSSVLAEVNKLENPPSWEINSPNEEVGFPLSSASGIEGVVIGLIMVSSGCLLLVWYLFVGQLIYLLKIDQWEILQNRSFFLKLVNRASASRQLFTIPVLLILLSGLTFMVYILLTLYSLGV